MSIGSGYFGMYGSGFAAAGDIIDVRVKSVSGQWISLIGPAGTDGIDGIDGIDGADGTTGPPGSDAPATTDASDLISGTLPLARLVDITNAQLAAAAAIDWTKISKAGSSLADLITRSAGDLSSGTLPDARLSSRVPFRDVAEAISSPWAFTNGFTEYGRTSLFGAFVDVPYSAANFTGSGGMGWDVASGDQATYEILQLGKNACIIYFTINTSNVTTPAGISLQITLPAGISSVSSRTAVIRLIDAGAYGIGYCTVGAGGTVILCRKFDNSLWTLTAANDTYVQGSILIKTP